MPDEKPVLYLVYGDDTFAMQAFVKEMVARMGDPGMAELNITRLDGRTATEEDLRTAAQSLPFLADRRLVIVTNALTLFRSEPARVRFLSLLDGLPATTALVLVVEDEWGKNDWEKLKSSHWLMKWTRSAGKRAYLAEQRQPTASAMPGWILEQAKQAGGQFERPAAEALAELVASDKALAALEIDKLLTYVDRSRPVEVEDVQSLTAAAFHTNVFDLVDDIGSGKRRDAIKKLETLLQEGDAFSLFGMVVRQFRLLIQAREAIDEGCSMEDLVHDCGMNYYAAKNIYPQARRFTLPQLIAIYHRLLEIDEDVKTSQIPIELALETFVAKV